MTANEAAPYILALTPLVSALAARWGSNSGIKAALRQVKIDIRRVESDATRAHTRIDDILRST